MTKNNALISSFAATLLAATFLAAIPEASVASETAPAVTQAPPAIRVVAAEKRELVETLTVTGTIIAREEAAAGTDLNGLTVDRLDADEGDTVKKGQVLAVLDRSSLDTQLAQIEASRAQAEANIAQMQAQIADAEVGVRQAMEAWQRADALKGKGVATQAQLDNSVNAHDSAQAKLEMARKAVAASEAQLAVIDAQKKNVMLQISKTEVKAPADGLVLARSATLGGVVSAAGGPLFRIAIGGEFELAADVPETVLPRIATGMKTDVVLAGANEAVVGKIRRISPEVDRASRLGSIRVALGDAAPARAGNFARGDIEMIRREGIAVPASAVVFEEDDAFLQLVEDGKVKTVPVTLGTRAGDMVEVAVGLEAGQEVVARAGTFVADGDLVTPVREETTGALQP